MPFVFFFVLFFMNVCVGVLFWTLDWDTKFSGMKKYTSLNLLPQSVGYFNCFNPHPLLRHRGTVNHLNNTSKVSDKTLLCPWVSFIRSRIRGSCQPRHSIIPLRTKLHLLAKGYVDTHLQCELTHITHTVVVIVYHSTNSGDFSGSKSMRH